MRPGQLYLISGVFFFQHTGIGIAYKSIEGAVAVLRSGVYPAFFSGVIRLNEETGRYTGCVQDYLNLAQLTEIRLSEEELIFTKQYEGRRPHPYPIQYRFEKDPTLGWKGTWYLANARLEGPTHCTLTPITEEFVNPPEEFLAKLKTN